jgi:hypothetical protein
VNIGSWRSPRLITGRAPKMLNSELPHHPRDGIIYRVLRKGVTTSLKATFEIELALKHETVWETLHF